MNADLEKELEVNPELAPVVRRLRCARQVDTSRSPRVPRLAASLLAASLLTALALSAWFSRSATPSAERPAHYGAREYHMTAEEMIATQNPDGSWQNDYLTRRNAAALRNIPSASVAYRKALRYLRMKGIGPHI